MAKADRTTPEQRAFLKQAAESAFAGESLRPSFKFFEKLAEDWRKAAETSPRPITEEERRRFDRDQGTPPWARKLLKAITKPEAVKGQKGRRVASIARKRWPPHGHPPSNLRPNQIVKFVGDDYQAKYGSTVSRNTILSTIRKLPRR